MKDGIILRPVVLPGIVGPAARRRPDAKFGQSMIAVALEKVDTFAV
jgi:hypothetical protein